MFELKLKDGLEFNYEFPFAPRSLDKRSLKNNEANDYPQQNYILVFAKTHIDFIIKQKRIYGTEMVTSNQKTSKTGHLNFIQINHFSLQH